MFNCKAHKNVLFNTLHKHEVKAFPDLKQSGTKFFNCTESKVVEDSNAVVYLIDE